MGVGRFGPVDPAQHGTSPSHRIDLEGLGGRAILADGLRRVDRLSTVITDDVADEEFVLESEAATAATVVDVSHLAPLSPSRRLRARGPRRSSIGASKASSADMLQHSTALGITAQRLLALGACAGRSAPKGWDEPSAARWRTLGGWCRTPLPRPVRMTLKDRASESPSPPLRVTSATDLIPENADFGRADRDIAKNTSLLIVLDLTKHY